MTFGELVRTTREGQGWSQSELSYEVRLPQPTISSIERGADSKLSTIEALCDALDIELPWAKGRYHQAGVLTHEEEARVAA